MSRINAGVARAGDTSPACGQLYDVCGDLASLSQPVVGRAVQITTVTVSGATDDTDYTLSLGEDADSLFATTIDSGTSSTTTTIATALAAAINANPNVNALVVATSAAAVVTIRSRRAGESFTASESDANLGTPSTTQSAATATPIAFGLITALSSSPAGCKVIDSGDLTAQVATLTPEYSAGDEWVVTVVWRGVPYSAIVTMATDLDTSIDAMVEALNDALPASSVLAAADDATATVLILTSELTGVPFSVASTASDIGGTVTAVAIAATTANAQPQLAGISRKAHTIEQDSSGDAAYASGDTVSCLRQGRIWVRLDAGHTISSLSDDVYVRVVATGTEKAGAFRSSADSTDCRLLSDFGWKGRWLTLHKSGFDGNTIAGLEISPL